jgi:hypothetical protein
LKLEKAVKVASCISVPYFYRHIDCAWFTKAPFKSIKSLHIDTTVMPTRIAADSLKLLPRDLRVLELKCLNAFPSLIRLVESYAPDCGLKEAFPHLEVLNCSGKGLQDELWKHLPPLRELRFTDFDYAVTDPSVLYGLPESLETLELSFSDIRLGNKPLPANLTRLQLVGLTAYSNLKPLPPCLTRLNISNSRRGDRDWDWSMLPQSLQHLSCFLENGLERWELWKLPRNLLSFVCWSMKQDIPWNVQDVRDLCKAAPNLNQLAVSAIEDFEELPRHLAWLQCISMPQKEFMHLLPQSLKKLTLYTENTDASLIPKGVTNLDLALDSDQIKNLPRGLKILNASRSALDEIPKDSLPPSLELLNIRASFSLLCSRNLERFPGSLTKLTLHVISRRGSHAKKDKNWPKALLHLSSSLSSLYLHIPSPHVVTVGTQSSLWETLSSFKALEKLHLSIPGLSAVPIEAHGLPPHVQTIYVNNLIHPFPFRVLPKSITDLGVTTIATIEDLGAIMNFLPPFLRSFHLSSGLPHPPAASIDRSLFPQTLTTFALDSFSFTVP